MDGFALIVYDRFPINNKNRKLLNKNTHEFSKETDE
jgi:hypothetical protein